MGKTFELGFSRLVIPALASKTDAMIKDVDKMSGLGWEMKSWVEDQPGQIVVFYQREAPATITVPPTNVTTTSPPPAQTAQTQSASN